MVAAPGVVHTRDVEVRAYMFAWNES